MVRRNRRASTDSRIEVGGVLEERRSGGDSGSPETEQAEGVGAKKHGGGKPPLEKKHQVDDLLKTKTAGYRPSTELDHIIFELNNPPSDQPPNPGEPVEVPNSSDVERRKRLPILKECIGKIPELSGNLTEEKLRHWLWRKYKVPPTQDLDADQLVHLLEHEQADRALEQPAVASTPGSTDGPRFIFKRDGENWAIRFHDEHGSFKPIDGLVYIARLLANPCREFSAEDLKRLTAVANAPSKALTEGSEEILDSQVGMTKGTLQKAADKKTIQACKHRLTIISVEREVASEAGDIEKLDDLEEEEKKINDYLASVQDVHGDSRPLADTQRSVINAVKQAIDRAMKKFTSADPPLPQLHDHLSRSLDSSNGVFEYRPPQPAPAWEL